MKSFAFVTLLTLCFIITGIMSKVSAVEVPSFPLCSNPQGSIVANYDNGVHGVVGDSAQYTGRDTVYSVNETQLLQCLCTDNGQGIQTNWWKVSSLTEDQISILKSEGWILIPDGSAWGLSPSVYLARNSSFACNTSNNNGGGSGGGSGDGRSDGRTDSLGCLKNDCSNQGRGQVLGISTGVLGLATTGNYVFILGIFLAGLLLLSTGLLLRFRKGR